MRLATAPLLAALGLLAPPATADVKPHSLFTDHMVLQRDKEIPVWGTADPGEAVSVTLGGMSGGPSADVTADQAGKWKATLPKRSAGTGLTLTIKGKNTVALNDVAVGEVWVCSGQSNMEWRFTQIRGGREQAEKAVSKNVRLFTVPKRPAKEPQAEVAKAAQPWETKWLESTPDTVATFSIVGYYFGRDLQKALNVPVGLIHTAWGGTPAQAWTSLPVLTGDDELKHYEGTREQMMKQAGDRPLNPHTPASLYNGMIHPLLPFAVKGAIWYQGESNAGRAAEYRTLFPAMIQDWRKRWGEDFPFLCVQLAPFHAGDADGVSYAELRDAQLHATKVLPGVGMAVITDVGDLFDIHPQQKEPVGGRLALAARAMAYGQKVPFSGPVYKDMKVEGDKAVLTFDHLGGGLVSRGTSGGTGPLNGFTICGEDKYFYPAKAEIKGDTVVVSSPKVPAPVAVRFGWKNFPVCNLFNRANLPATPFRTDDFPLTTAGKK